MEPRPNWFVGVDAGSANMAICCIRKDQGKQPYYWKLECLQKGKVTEEELAQKMHEFLQREHTRMLFEAADVIVLEKQMQSRFKLVNNFIQATYFEKTRLLHPSKIAGKYKLPKLRKDKKKAAVAYVRERAIFPAQKGKKKLDDLADAYLLADYFIE